MRELALMTLVLHFLKLIISSLHQLIASWRAFWEEDEIRRSSHLRHARECISFDAMLCNLANVIGTQAVTFLVAGSTLLGPFGPLLSTILSVAVVLILQPTLERVVEAKEQAGGYQALLSSWLSSPGPTPEWQGSLLDQYRHLITPHLKCPITDNLV